jgi:hypothetical protein
MGEVAASVGIVEAQTAPASMSFVDETDGADPAAAILDEVLTGAPAPVEGEAPAEGAEAAPDGDAAPGDKPAELAAAAAEPVKETPPTDIEAAKLRRGFAKLAEERQRLVELQNSARAERAAAQSFATKAQKHDELVSALERDPAAALLAHGGEALVQKALRGFIDMEKSPAEREVAKLREERDRDKAADRQREIEATAARWRNDIIAKVQADERFDLVNSMGLHREVTDIITGYYDRYSKRDDKGNVVEPAILPWEAAAQAAEDHRAAMLEQIQAVREAHARRDRGKHPGQERRASSEAATGPREEGPHVAFERPRRRHASHRG